MDNRLKDTILEDVVLVREDTDYSILSDEELLELVFGYVQSGLTIPKKVESICKDKHIWECIEPLIGEHDVEDIMDEIETGLY